MAFQGLGQNPNSNYFSFLARKPNEGKVPLASEMITGSSHIIAIDSRERDLRMYPNPASYSIMFNKRFKNVTSLELKGAVLPKTEYNVNTGNRFIPFNVQDYITSINIVNPGYGYVNGSYGFATLNPNGVAITLPAISTGIQAQITVTVQDSSITSVIIQQRGTGYLNGFYGNSANDPDSGFYNKAGASFINNIPLNLNL